MPTNITKWKITIDADGLHMILANEDAVVVVSCSVSDVIFENIADAVMLAEAILKAVENLPSSRRRE